LPNKSIDIWHVSLKKCQFFTFHYQGLTKNLTAEIVKIMAAPGTVLVDLVGYLASPSPSGAGAGAFGSGGSGGSGRKLEAWGDHVRMLKTTPRSIKVNIFKLKMQEFGSIWHL